MQRPNFHTEGLSHIDRIERYVREIEDIIRKADKRAAQIAKQTGHKSGAFRWRDYPQTKKRIDDLFQQMHDEIQAVILNGEKAEWAMANNVTDELANYYLQRSGQIREVFGSVAAYEGTRFARYFDRNEKALATFTRRKVAGMNLSQRVWNLVDQHKENLELGLSLGIAEGRSAAQIARDVRKHLNEPDKLFRRVRELVTDADGNKTRTGNLVLSKAAQAYNPGAGVYRSSYQNAFRLARTEINMAYRSADQERWAQLDFVVGYKIIRSNNPYSCPVCESLTGNYPKNFVFTGWHPNCRCIKVPILKTVEEMEQDDERIMRGQEPKRRSENAVKDVPESFRSWMAKNADRIEKANNRGTLPYFIKDNPKYTGVSVNSINTPAGIDIRQNALKKYRSYGSEWEKVYFDRFSGGDNVYHKDHQFSNYKGGGEAEMIVGRSLARYNGKQVEFMSERGTEGKKSDLFFDGQTWDVRRINENTIKAFRRNINKAKAKESDNVIFYLTDQTMYSTMRNAINSEVGSRIKNGSWINLPNMYYINEHGLLKVVWKK